MPVSRLERFEVDDPVHGRVPCTAILPSSSDGPLPVCGFLFGGGGSAETLAGIQGLLDGWWAAGSLPPLLVATPGVGPWSFYLDDPAHGLGWESFVGTRFLPCVHERFASAAVPTGWLGISMGGYGALKLAFAQPQRFAAVAAISPMLEPALDGADCPLRNRYHYPPDVPQALLGPERDTELYRADHPAARARRNAAALRGSGLPIYIDAAGRDALNAHDGAEFLHRVLWQLDIPHDYQLRRDSDHAGPDFVDRMLDAFRWTARHLAPAPPPPLDANELAWQAWLEQPDGSPPAQPLAPTSSLFPRLLRLQLAAARAEAEPLDPTFTRHYGLGRLECEV